MSELGPPHASDSLVEAALKVLNCPDPWIKAEYTYKAVELWRNGSIRSIRPRHWRELKVPDRPARADDRVSDNEEHIAAILLHRPIGLC